MKHKSKILIGVVAIAIVLCASVVVVRQNSVTGYGDSESDIKAMLVAHYQPGTCYGMPPGRGEPDITLEKREDGWRYKVEDGECCEITSHEGSVKEEGDQKQIIEASSRNYNQPC